MEIEPKLLDPIEWKVLKVIEFSDHRTYPFYAYLPYSRDLNFKNFNTATKPDEIDNKILKEIQNMYPNAKLIYNIKLIWTNQLEHYLQIINRQDSIDFDLYFAPDITSDQIQNGQVEYVNIIKRLKLQISFIVNRPDNFNFILNSYPIILDNLNFNEKVETINHI
ncbi:hypothetical protein [Chryseobacterium sp.]|uniref:hypothetical protein n=1 Tax=Chryseobacterium sp. TaxID=1871047 RepID=UPI0028992C08|nr:hypothetical protein [Chryseobacterium sp.]